MSERKGTKALELWCKRLVKDCPEVQIDNMTTSWRNGIAFCALVHHFRPDLIDMTKLKPENIYENNQLAFSVAEKHLGIPALLDPEDMVETEVPDRLSILTYLSQFYQRLSHTVNTKVTESESKVTLSNDLPPSKPAPIKFGKAGLDKCTACGLPVYLAQRLLVSHKLYHRRCFRCSKCSGHLNPKNFDVVEGSDFMCDSCKNEKSMSKIFNNNHNEQMGMLAYSDDLSGKIVDMSNKNSVSPKQKARPLSILEKISMFETIDKKSNLDGKMVNLTFNDDTMSTKDNTSTLQKDLTTNQAHYTINNTEMEYPRTAPEKVYKSDIHKFNFLQTQLLNDNLDTNNSKSDVVNDMNHEKEDILNTNDIVKKLEVNVAINDDLSPIKSEGNKEESNITDDIRLAITNNSITSLEDVLNVEQSGITEEEIKISVPPRRKKLQGNKTKSPEPYESVKKIDIKEYPDHLNPFSDDEEEQSSESKKKVSTNPFGSSDEEDDNVPPIQTPPKIPTVKDTSSPGRRLIAANPFWSDGEEPSSDEEHTHTSGSSMYKSSMTTSTPNLPGSIGRRKKPRAPLPPAITVTSPRTDLATSTDDVASICSLSSYNSTLNSDQKSIGILTPSMKKKPPTPSQADNVSLHSGTGESMDKSVDSSGTRRVKGPAPGLPLPERREVKMQMSPAELQTQLDLLETQQLGLERQGVLIEKMIRDKCEGDEAATVPQEEVEDLVIQLCELVNEKNDLFRRQTELMYIRRQQRLEQEQADIEHEIRIIQSRPAVNRIDADKAREEQLVARLVEIVRMRDELVQQIEAERRRERQEDLAIAASIAQKRAQRNSESTSSSMKSMEVLPTPKKNKVKDKVKKQFKKAKHTLIPKKKDEQTDKKEEKTEKKSK